MSYFTMFYQTDRRGVSI